MKTCSKCKIEKALEDFYPRKDRKSGYMSHCKECDKSKCKSYQLLSKESVKAARRRYYSDNKEDILMKVKQYGSQNKKRLSKAKQRRTKERAIVDPNFKLRLMLRKRISASLKGACKAGSAVQDLGCSVDQLRKYIESLFKDNMSWQNWGRGPGKWNLDHVKPLCKFDLTDRNQFMMACHYTNLQPLWHEQHMAKTVIDIRKDVA